MNKQLQARRFPAPQAVTNKSSKLPSANMDYKTVCPALKLTWALIIAVFTPHFLAACSQKQDTKPALVSSLLLKHNAVA